MLWGNITNYWNAEGATTIPAEGILLDRGYTGHEHLQTVGLIHMNGRLYDPALHRFLQPDNYVQDPFNTQNFNRYGYVLNNPLLYIDPTGEYGEEGLTPNQQRGLAGLIASIGYTVKENWGDIKDWVGRNARSTGKWFEKQGRSVGEWFSKQYNSVKGWFEGDGTPREGKTEYLTAEEAYKNQVWQIRPPTQHYFLGMNMTAMSEGNYLEKVIYGVINDLYTPVQFLMGRSVNCEFANMRNLNGTSKTTQEAAIGFASSAFLVFDIAYRGIVTGLEMTRAAVPMATEMTTVGRWMSRAEYDIMLKTGRVVEGAGGQTFVATGGSGAFNAAPKGSVYVEFQVPTNSLLQGGKSNWFKLIGPNASKSQRFLLEKQGGQILPEAKNITPVLKVK